MEGTDLHVDDFSIEGPGAGQSSVSELRSLARALGRAAGADRVVIQGTDRVSGAVIGKIPRPIIVKVP